MSIEQEQQRIADAGEYVIGTLSPAERQALQARLPHDAALLREVYAWQDRLLGLSRKLLPVSPPQGIWPRIAARLDGERGLARAANEPLWRGLRFWQGLSGLALAASVLLATLLASAPQQEAAPRYLVVLQAPQNKAADWVVESVGGRAIRLVPVGAAQPVPAGKVMQFWTKPEGAKGPTSLGLVQPGQVVVVPVDKLPGLAERTLFELTLEPDGGSPYERPSGPILYVGKAVRL